MTPIDLKERSTWRGIAMVIAGGFGMYYIGPEIAALSAATTTEPSSATVVNSRVLECPVAQCIYIDGSLVCELRSDVLTSLPYEKVSLSFSAS